MGGHRLNARTAPRATASALAIALVGTLVATSAFADPVTNNQSGAQSNAGNTNNTAAMLGEAAGVLSMASGGLYMAKGVQELGCCVQGCNNGSGQQSVSTATAQNAATAQQGSALAKSQGVTTPLNILPVNLGSSSGSKGNGCLDGALALATGGLMMLSGIMSLEAANQASQNGAAALNNAGDMGAMPSSSAPGASILSNGTSTSSGISSTSLAGASGSSVAIDPALLRTGTANNIMGQFESQFGIPRDSFAQGVLNGQDPRQMLNSAPANPISNADMNKALSSAQNMSDADKAKALSGTALAAAQDELVAKMDGAGTRAPASKGAGLGAVDEGNALSEADGAPSGAASGMAVSPEILAALKAKQASENKPVDWELLSLFERVHGKYREKAKMIFGYDPDGELKGVGNANGT